MGLVIGLTAINLLAGCEQQPKTVAPAFDASEHSPGGKATIKNFNYRTFIKPGAHLTGLDRVDFWAGFTFFEMPWVEAPASTSVRDGLGPLFNTHSCLSCHGKGSRGKFFDEGIGEQSGLLIRLGPTHPNAPKVDPVYGGQIQVRTIAAAKKYLTDPLLPEAKIDLAFEYTDGQYADGESYQLRKPIIKLAELGYGELASGIGLSPRFGPNIFGMGLLDAISDKDLIAQEDLADANGDHISAKYNRGLDVVTGEKAIGRYGFKAKHPNLLQQVTDAFNNDIGIVNPLFPNEVCTDSQPGCQQASKITNPKGEHEIAERLVQDVMIFSRHIGVPPARNLEDTETQQGRELFYQLNCQACHTPSYTTSATYPHQDLASIKIWPYTDLALHDMGEGLADGVFENDANGKEWRTPPLWGIGLQQQVQGQQLFLHDGRARSISEAILWHGGEAQASQQVFKQLTATERKALIKFLRAI
ncbi:hypothetical protein DXX93_15355 [Thalassotalea euphylliae]|uniref:Cytochrome c domain-containing protein n=1 Tax=Thalassotalea euphylliae TaxID=1655234 RepID=A0A3E0TYM2_9GAMM|nr:hypothetical protein DXX93_15355 [Thalassotalea euphylliae]